MKTSKNKFVNVVAAMAIVLVMVCTSDLYAQSPPDGATNTQDVPLDGGLIALVIGAAAFGVKKLRDNLK